MFPTLQPSRPRTSSSSESHQRAQHQHPHQLPLRPLPPYLHHQIRTLTQSQSQPQPQPQIPSSALSALSAHPPPPQSQIEAMPPFLAPTMPQPKLSGMPVSHHYDSAVRHPVFFTGGLRKPPFPLPDGVAGGGAGGAGHVVNPVAHGYVWEGGMVGGAGGNGKTKL